MSPRKITNVSYDYRDQVVVITGGARGQGRAHALAFAAAGADIVVADIAAPMPSVPYSLATPQDLEQIAAEVRATGRQCLAIVCDVRDSRQVRSMITQAVTKFGRIDILINNAGMESLPTVAEMTEEHWDEMLDTHLKGTFLCSKYASAHMIPAGRGRILATGSTLSVVGGPDQAHYSAAKHGMVGFAKSLAIELAPHGITVNVVCPGGVDTPLVSGLLASIGERGDVEGLNEIGGPFNLFDPTAMLDAQEITHAMMWLASDAAAFVTGAVLMVDAGFTIK
jgi:NAD(P)-dependent dehydrogenase (short-subunit alcohol dehydrogenase family)